MRFVVFGAGAIGSGMGGHLHRTGHDALIVGRPGHVNRIRQHGLQLVTDEQTYTLAVPAVARAEDVHFTPDDVLLLCVKSQDTDRALVEIRAAGGDPQTLPILCCQNSITNEPAAARYFRRVYGVLIVVPGVFLEPGVVVNNSLGNAGFIEVGQFPTGQDQLSEDVASALTAASYAAYANPDVMATKAAKMFSNANVPFESPQAFEKRSREQHRQSPLPPGVRNLGSSWQSLQRGLGSIEADFLNGEIVRLGRIYGVPTPYNEVLQEVANAMAAQHEKPGRYTAQDLEHLAERRAASPGGSPAPR